MSPRLLFVCDALSGFATYKDTTFAMMREAQRRGAMLYMATLHELKASVENEQPGFSAFAHHFQIQDAQSPQWWIESDARWRSAAEFDAIFMRKDPPFDQDYLVATQLLEIAERQGVRVFNSPQALRDHGEKMSALEFPQFTPPTLVASDMGSLKSFAVHHQKIVVKPLDAMGGTGVFVLDARDPNLPSAIEVLSNNGRRAIVAQRYLPEIVLGDKRIVVIDGKPIDYALARIPPAGQSRGNLAAGGKGVAQPLSPRDREIATAVGQMLAKRGLLFIGIDVIGDYLTEINVTSPTGFQEITDQSGIDVARIFMDAVWSRLPS
jgi:glutathione synthase